MFNFTLLQLSEISIPHFLAASIFSAQSGESMIFYRNAKLLVLLCFASGICRLISCMSLIPVYSFKYFVMVHPEVNFSSKHRCCLLISGYYGYKWTINCWCSSSSPFLRFIHSCVVLMHCSVWPWCMLILSRLIIVIVSKLLATILDLWNDRIALSHLETFCSNSHYMMAI